jgi:pilus assembly protein CpaB
MSDEYLWDKSGSDPAVEKLERALGALRFDRAPPPSVVPSAERAVPRPPPPVFSLSPVRGRMPLLSALSLGLLAGAVSYSAIKKKESDVRRGWNLVPVVVASMDVPEGAVLSFDQVSQRAVPEQFVTSSVVKPDSASYVVGQRVLVPIQAGDPLLWSQFETTRAAERLSTKVQMRTRALTVEAARTASVGGWIRPNDHIDVIGTFRDPHGNEQVAVTLLQNVIVLATGKITGTTNLNLLPENRRDYSNLSLLLIPEEAELLVLAQALGQLHFTLRNEDDVDVVEDRGRATLHTLLSGERTRALQERRQSIIEVIRGSSSRPQPPVK